MVRRTWLALNDTSTDPTASDGAYTHIIPHPMPPNTGFPVKTAENTRRSHWWSQVKSLREERVRAEQPCEKHGRTHISARVYDLGTKRLPSRPRGPFQGR